MSLDPIIEFFASNPAATAFVTSLFFAYMVYTDRTVGNGTDNRYVQLFVRDLKFFNKLTLTLSLAFTVMFAIKALFFG